MFYYFVGYLIFEQKKTINCTSSDSVKCFKYGQTYFQNLLDQINKKTASTYIVSIHYVKLF